MSSRVNGHTPDRASHAAAGTDQRPWSDDAAALSVLRVAKLRGSARVVPSEPASRLPAVATDTTFEAVIFGWDGTAVRDRRADASAVRACVEALCAAGVHVIIVSGTHVDDVDGQLAARPAGPGQLHLCLNHGSEVFAVTGEGPALRWRRTATPDEEQALDRAADLAAERLQARGIDACVVSPRLNRRTLDLIPEPEWADPPDTRIGELLVAVTRRLAGAGLAGLTEVVAIAAGAARTAGLADPRVTSDVKHVEIGLTDTSDSARWAAAWLAERGITGGLVLVGGDEFGALGGVAGGDSLMLVAELARARAVSVGVEPGGSPERVLHVGGGPARFLEILGGQLARRRDHRVPSIDPDPAWVLPLPNDPHAQRAAEALGALVNGWAGSRGTYEDDGPASLPLFAVTGMYTVGPVPELLAGPRWDALAIASTDGDAEDRARNERVVDLRTGIVARSDRSGLRTLRFLSAARPAALALRAEAPPSRLQRGGGLAAPGDDATFERGRRRGADVARVRSPADGGITMAARDRDRIARSRWMVERLAAWCGRRKRGGA